MTDGKGWRQRQDEMRAAIADDRARAAQEKSERLRQIEQNYHNPVAFYAGVIILISLAALAWYLFDQMRCNPLASDVALVGGKSCRASP